MAYLAIQAQQSCLGTPVYVYMFICLYIYMFESIYQYEGMPNAMLVMLWDMIEEDQS